MIKCERLRRDEKRIKNEEEVVIMEGIEKRHGGD